MLSGSCYRFVLLGLCISLLRQWCEWKGEGQVQDKTSCNLAVKHLLHGHLRKTRLWRRVVGETRHSRGKGRPAWFLLGILLLSGDVELNPGPKTRTADKDYASPPTTSPSSNLSIADHFKVTQVLKALDNKQLIHLGTALGLEYPHLKRMQTLPEDMVAAWLNMKDEVMDTSGTPTWSSLVKALEDTNQKDVASRIKEDYASPPTTSPSSNLLTTADHFKVTQVLKALDNVHLIRLGTALGLKYPRLRRMQTLPDDLIFAWLNMEDEVMDTSGIPTWSSLVKALEDTDQNDVASRIKEAPHTDPLHGEIQRHKEACIKIIEEKLSVDIDIIRLVYFGLPRSGKTSTMRRLMGDMLNILIAMKEKEEPSTGVADVKQIFVRNIYSEVGTIISSKWSRADLQEEAAMLTQFFYQVAEHSAAKNPSSQGKPPSTGKATAQISPTTDFSTSNPSLSSASNPLSSNKETSRDKGADIDEMFSAFEEAIKTNSLDKVKYLLEDTTLLINTDTGGHAEFLEMHAALVMGPSLYLLFSRLTDKLESLFKVYYTNEEGKSSEKEDSTLTMEEVFFQALSSIACFSGSSPDVSDTVSGAPAENCKQTKYCTSHSESKALFVGTHLDKINQRKLKKKDELLQKKVTCTSFYTKGIIERASEDQLMLAVNNYSGDQEEIEEVRNILDRIIKNRFKKIRIPAAWLMLSLYIRRKDLRVMTLDECARLAAKLGIDPQEELQEALWFLHHCVGLILYYPKLDVLKDTVICNVQVIFDSVTKLIKNTFTLDKVTPTRVDEFREKAQFTMEDIENSASSGTDATIPLDKLVKLLEYLNILTRFTPTNVRSGEVTYFMPSILRSARADDLKVRTSRKDPAPLMLRYNCGYVPFGVFSYMITNIVSKQTKWRLIEDKIWKNKVQFHVGSDYDKVTLISRPLYIEVVVSRSSNPQTPTKVLCAHIRQVVLSTLKIEKNFTRDFKFAFECPAHSGRDHLCVLASETARQMECLKNPKKIRPIPLKDSRCMVWFEESSTDDERHASEATPQSLGDSLPANMDEKELRSDDHGEVLDSVKSLSAQWRRLSSKLGLEISSLDRIEKDNPGDCMMCLDKALVEWLNLNYNCSKHGRPSWKRSATAVKDLDYALFERIVKEHQAETTSC